MTDTFLTEEEFERKRYLKRLIDDGYYEPYRVDLGDVAALMASKNIVSEENAQSFNFCREDEEKLLKMLENDWDNLSDYDKTLSHNQPYRGSSDVAQTISPNARIYGKFEGIPEHRSQIDKI